MAIRKREAPQLRMNFGAHIETDYHDQSIKRLCILFLYEGRVKIEHFLPTSRALQLRDKLNELYPDGE